jgi:hypothetical protein
MKWLFLDREIFKPKSYREFLDREILARFCTIVSRSRNIQQKKRSAVSRSRNNGYNYISVFFFRVDKNWIRIVVELSPHWFSSVCNSITGLFREGRSQTHSRLANTKPSHSVNPKLNLVVCLWTYQCLSCQKTCWNRSTTCFIYQVLR